jgi:hypothetical protein
MSYLPVIGAAGAFVATAAIGYYAGRRMGHPRIGVAIGSVAGLVAANAVGSMLDTGNPVEGATPSIGERSSKAKLKSAEAVDSPSVVIDAKEQPSNTGLVNEADYDKVNGKGGVMAFVAAPIQTVRAAVDSRYTRTSPTREESRDPSTFIFNPRNLLPRN